MKVTAAEAKKAKRMEEKHSDKSVEAYVPKLEWACARCQFGRNGKSTLAVATEHCRLS